MAPWPARRVIRASLRFFGPLSLRESTNTVSAEQGGGLVRVFVQQISAKLVAITVEHYSKIIVTYPGGIRMWTIS